MNTSPSGAVSDSPPPAQTSFKFRRFVTPARVYAVTRIAIGPWLLVDPSGFGHKWMTAPQDPLLTGSFIRGAGGRDLDIGVGLLFAERPQEWLLLCAFCDALDAGLVFLTRSKFSHEEVVNGVVGALSYALIGVALAAWTSRTRPATVANWGAR